MSKPKKNRARKCWTTAVTGVASVAVASAYGAHLLPLDEPRTMSYDVMETAAIVESPSTIGVAEGSDLYWAAVAAVTPEARDQVINDALDAMQSLGVQTVRVGIPWGLVEHPIFPGAYDWRVVDAIINLAVAPTRNMGVLGVINTSPLRYGLPPGAAHPPAGSPEFAAYLDAFSDFSSAVAQRYKGKVSAYEIWNEPNYIQFWNAVDATAYTQLLKTGYMAIKGDPNNPNDGLDESALVIGGVVGATQNSFLTVDPVTFVEQMYQQGARGYFDALSFHPYGNLPFTDRDVNTTLRTPIEQLEAIRAVMDRRGDPYLKIWISEYGVSTEGWVTPEEKQAAYEKQYKYIENILENWKKVDGAGPIFLYTTRDTATGAPEAELNFGIFETDWDAKPVAQLIENMIACGMAQCPATTPNTSTPPPMDPISAFFAGLSMAFNNAFSFLPNFFSGFFNVGSFFSAIGNFFGSLFGAPAAPAATVAAAPPNETFALMADEADTGTASRTVDPDAVAAASDGKEVDDGLGDVNNLAEGDALPGDEELEPTVEKPLVVEPAVETDVDPDLELSKVETDNDELKDDELKDDELKDDELKDDDDAKTADVTPAAGTVTNGSVTTKENDDPTRENKPDPDKTGEAGDEGGDDAGSEGGAET